MDAISSVDKIKQSYLIPSEPGSYSGLSTFIKSQSKNNKISTADINKIKAALLNEESYTLHQPALKKFTRMYQ